MNKEQVKNILPILQAFAEGKIIRFDCLDGTFIDIENGNEINFKTLIKAPQNYHIKEKPKCCAFKNAEEFINTLESHGGYVTFKDKYAKLYKPLYMDNNGVAFCAFGGKEADIQKFSYEKMAKVCSFIDLTGCFTEV